MYTHYNDMNPIPDSAPPQSFEIQNPTLVDICQTKIQPSDFSPSVTQSTPESAKAGNCQTTFSGADGWLPASCGDADRGHVMDHVPRDQWSDTPRPCPAAWSLRDNQSRPAFIIKGEPRHC